MLNFKGYILSPAVSTGSAPLEQQVFSDFIAL
jgi:hypothetical protein